MIFEFWRHILTFWHQIFDIWRRYFDFWSQNLKSCFFKVNRGGGGWGSGDQKTKAKNEEKHREEILDRIEEGWQEEEWAIIMPQVVNEILQKNLTTTRNPIATRTSHAAEGIQWIRMEELGKALTTTCRAVRESTNEKQKMQGGYTRWQLLQIEQYGVHHSC